MTELDIRRYDLSQDKSLRAWSAADEYLLNELADLESEPEHIGVYHDRFGFVTCHLEGLEPVTVVTNSSQEYAIRKNVSVNALSLPQIKTPLDSMDQLFDLVLLKIPKSLDLFRLYLEQIAQYSKEGVVVKCAFMTRHFTAKMLEIAGDYFETVEQGKAVKKARVLTLSQKKPHKKENLLNALVYKEQTYQQYLGVFSANHIDYATQFFLDNMEVLDSDERVLDLASGNGIIGGELLRQYPRLEMHLMDDSNLAVASAQMNVSGDAVHHYCNHELSGFDADSFDLIVSNPPFHFEYDVNIQIPLALFKECHRCLKPGGRLEIVASHHLNYKTHLAPLFSAVEIVAEDKKFVIYSCKK